MNLVLFEPGELDRPLPRTDRRARHVVEILRRKPGEPFDAGVINGPRGKAVILAEDAATLTLQFTPLGGESPREPLALIVGLPRPQTARDILRDATTLGVGTIDFVRTERSEPSYAQSTLWSSGEWRRHAIAGAEQAFDTRLPDITHGATLATALARLGATERFALDNYEAAERLGACEVRPDRAVALAIGSERGWSDEERVLLREHRFLFVHLGARVLRTEAAVLAAVTLIRAQLGLM